MLQKCNEQGKGGVELRLQLEYKMTKNDVILKEKKESVTFSQLVISRTLKHS